MFVKTLSLNNFGPIREALIEFALVTVVYGKNGTGKSSLIDALLHILCGDPYRGGDVRAVVTQGETKMSANVILEGDHVLMRTRTKSGGTAKVGGVLVDDEAFNLQVFGATGQDPETIRAVLRSGEILSMKPGPLQAMLTQLTRASFDAETIAKAWAPATVQAAVRLGLALPTSLGEFAAGKAKAEDRRLTAFRDLKVKRGDLERLPALHEVPAGATVAGVDAKLAELRTERDQIVRSQEAADAYDAGAVEAKKVAVRARISEAEAVPAAPAVDLAAAERSVESARGALATAEKNVTKLTERATSLRARAEGDKTLPADAVDAAALKKADAELAAARTNVATAEADLVRVEAQIADLKPHAEGPTTLPDDEKEIPGNLQKAAAALAESERTVAMVAAETNRRRKLLDGAAKGATCDSCGSDIHADHVEGLRLRVGQAEDDERKQRADLAKDVAAHVAAAKRDATRTERMARAKVQAELASAEARATELRAGLVSGRQAIETADATAGGLRTRAATTEAIKARIAAAAEWETVEVQVREAAALAAVQFTTFTIARDRLADLRPAAEKHAAYTHAQAALVKARAELAALDKPAPERPAGDVAALDERLAKGAALRQKLVDNAARATAEQAIAALEATHSDADVVAKATGPGGVYADLIAAGMAPFLDDANAALARLWPEVTLGMNPDEFGFLVHQGETACVPSALSDGHFTRLTYVLQYAAGQRASIPLLVLDRTELLDGDEGLRSLMAACRDEGVQVVMLTCRAPKPGVSGYVMEGGTCRPLLKAVA